MNNTTSYSNNQETDNSLPPEFYTILFSILASVGTYTIRGIFEKYNSFIIEKKTAIRKERFIRLKDKLSLFYWPIYIKLLRAEQLWAKISNVDKVQETFRLNHSDEVTPVLSPNDNTKIDEEDVLLQFNKEDSTHIGKYGGFVPVNEEDLAAFKIQRYYRIKHSNKKKIKMNKISRVLSTNNDSKYFDLSISLDGIHNDIEKNLHSINNDSTNFNLRLTAGFLKTCDKMLLDIHLDIARIIDNKIAIAEPNDDLSKTLLQYIRHITLYKILRDSSEYNIWPHDFGESYPVNLKKLIESETYKLQNEYNELMQIHKPIY